ncbi:hypothetical protein MASR2M15_12430 [Anaerolineales bacterium]
MSEENDSLSPESLSEQDAPSLINQSWDLDFPSDELGDESRVNFDVEEGTQEITRRMDRPALAFADQSWQLDFPDPALNNLEEEQPPSSLAASSQSDMPPAPPENKSLHTPVSAQLIAQENFFKMTSPMETPWTLQQFFDGEIDLDAELSKRFPKMPMLSIIKFRTLGTSTGRKVANLSSQDGTAILTIDADMITKSVQMSFTFGSMLTLRFQLYDLNDANRRRWLELMRREQGGLAFLWGPNRWENDYLVCITRKYFSNLYAFSPSGFEAAIRLTPDITVSLLDWLEEVWAAYFDQEDNPDLLTW